LVSSEKRLALQCQPSSRFAGYEMREAVLY